MADQIPTQSAHPWRAVLRTTAAVAVALLPMLPAIIDAAGVSRSATGVAGTLAVAATATRILAIPAVNATLQKWLPALAAEPRE
jgi:hypothetical protein